MSHPHVFPSAEYWLASRRGEKKAKQTQHIQILKKKKKEYYNLHKKHKVLDSNNAMKTSLKFSYILQCPCQDVNPAIMYSLRLFSSLLPIWD